MIKNFFITGRPRCGKTTLIIEIVKEMNLDAGGFYTQEIREGGVRKGFKITTLDGKTGILAHTDIESPLRVGKYKVNIKDLEEIAVESILRAQRENKTILCDEIGKMEMKSEKFKKAVLAALDSKSRVLGTIKITPDSFTDKIRKRLQPTHRPPAAGGPLDTKIFYLTRENRAKIKKQIKNYLV